MFTMLTYIKPYKWLIASIITLTLASTLFELYIPTLMANVIDIGITDSNLPYIIQSGVWMLVLSMLTILVTIVSIYLSSKVATGFGRDLRRALFVKVENLPIETLNSFGPATLITRTTNDSKQVQDVLSLILGTVTRAPLMLIGGIILAINREPKLSLIFLAALPILIFLIVGVMKKAIPLFEVLQTKTDRLNLVIRESLTGIRVTRAFNQVNYEKKRFNIANEGFRDNGIKVNKTMALLFPVMQLIINFTNIAIVWFGAIRINEGTMMVGNMMAFLQYALMIFMAFIMLSIAFMKLPRALASVKRISEVLEVEAIVKDPKETRESSKNKSGFIQLKNVTYRYEGAERAAVENISFKVCQGQTTAIIGGTGSGKTTLIQLILRFFDPVEGEILVNDIDVRFISQRKFREKIGYVPQKAILFSGTIEENLRLSNKDVTEKEIVEALTIAEAIDFVNLKEKGIHSVLHQAGSNLSGGQKQRLSIARALVRKPEIYIFDDSFSALDYQTDAKLRRSLKGKLDATIIIVSQRISSIMDADQIIVLDQGKMVGQGTHEYLLRNSIVYQEIVASQQIEEGVS
ncbi:ABC transporter ATP-binding protein [Bacillus sp. EB106-08-02-XG196]|jgi:ATP-binding cassette, subfamily B, multidrug efflux pump|uniref:ABC transporter ATP-binding protein n=1 Tax=Bacillus sp. EB106-08-02-XG196 TaxID=2737049 RepID=UPI0015C4B35B|nr:ABC transporter ATP-binding protein [Bacillus sp. EB106-08-02-XG196]NWQ40321.1 ABC transporter ATP-binding protein [Bacillus sp. EB106-08-02-XG196]